ncbi:OmpA family protein [Acanthopleuribacter pedis]|uniref:OmpA family protein n=1 Tax=Acanthopleuribacter pedis TaxID=442870 RepID=A0A8J7U4R0_9BACT|nr:OmpA family protein [Acanthopleuribacter pedis]MBO1319708.1 OmpA family protein [Acanthopleuribacter pedis]
MRSIALTLILCLCSMSCATKQFVDREIEASESRTQRQIEDIKRQVEETQTEIKDMASEMGLKIEGLEETNDDISKMVSENQQMIAQFGQLRFQKTLSEAEANFRSDKFELTEPAREQLDKFAQLLLSQNKLVHIEIQGHTDSRGSEDYNMRLGQQRADSVREYLYKQHDIPLHLMNTVSYGADKPISENNNAEGRAKNRRVVLVVRMQF